MSRPTLARLVGQRAVLPFRNRWNHPATSVAVADVLRVLSDDELAAAVRHERAHWTARDNLKRLLLLLAPDFLLFLGGFGILEHEWAKFTESAADDLAVAGDAGRSLGLATALVRVARLGCASRAPVLVAPLLADNDDLQARVRAPAQLCPARGATSLASALLVGGRRYHSIRTFGDGGASTNRAFRGTQVPGRSHPVPPNCDLWQ